MSETSSPYPISMSIDYPDRNLNRLTTFFRIFTVIPIAIIIGLLSSAECCQSAKWDTFRTEHFGMIMRQ